MGRVQGSDAGSPGTGSSGTVIRRAPGPSTAPRPEDHPEDTREDTLESPAKKPAHRPPVDLPTGVLAKPAVHPLPVPVPLRKMIGPGIILAGLAIGSGEFVLWPRLTAEWGFAVFWAALVGVTIQFFLNMEIERYTLATGESAVVGFLRLSRVFGPVFLLCGTVPWIWPGWATGAGTILSWEVGGDATFYGVLGLVLCGLLLSLGPVVYRTVELVQVVLVGSIFLALVVLAFFVVTPDSLSALGSGIADFGTIPEGIELPLLLSALAFAGAGGTTNLAQSNYVRDKGYGMGAWVGRITSPLTGREEAGGDVGFVFSGTEDDRARWKVWWCRSNLEHGLTFYLLSIFSITLLSLITFSLLGTGGEVSPGFDFIRDQGVALEERFGVLARQAFFGAGIAVLLSTELALLDAVTRVVTDLVHTIFCRDNPRWSLSRLYFFLLWAFIVSGVVILYSGLTQPLTLIVISAALNAVVMFFYSGLLLVLNLRSFRPPRSPRPRPHPGPPGLGGLLRHLQLDDHRGPAGEAGVTESASPAVGARMRGSVRPALPPGPGGTRPWRPGWTRGPLGSTERPDRKPDEEASMKNVLKGALCLGLALPPWPPTRRPRRGRDAGDEVRREVREERRQEIRERRDQVRERRARARKDGARKRGEKAEKHLRDEIKEIRKRINGRSEEAGEDPQGRGEAPAGRSRRRGGGAMRRSGRRRSGASARKSARRGRAARGSVAAGTRRPCSEVLAPLALFGAA